MRLLIAVWFAAIAAVFTAQGNPPLGAIFLILSLLNGWVYVAKTDGQSTFTLDGDI